MASSVPEESYGYDTSRFEKDVDENFHCSICYNVLKEPRMCRNNEHIFCLACITRSLNLTNQTCPECSEDLSVDTLRRAPRVLNNYLSELKIKCDYASRGCSEFVRLESLNTHVENCGFAPVLCSIEECGMEINKQDKAHHESAICEYRKLKCHNCGQMQRSLIRLEGILGNMNKKINQKEEALEKSIKQDFEKLEVLEKEVAELKVMMGQMLEGFNKLGPMAPLGQGYRDGSLPIPSAVFPPHIWAPPWLPPGQPLMPPPIRPPMRPPMRPPKRPSMRPLQRPTSTSGQNVLFPSFFPRLSAADEKRMLGERLFPLIQQTHPDLAGKITGMLLEMDKEELLYMLEFRDALAAKVEEAVSVLQAHQEREQKQECEKDDA